MQGGDEHAVVVAGGGPTGMMLAAELALAEVDVAIVEPQSGPGLGPVRSRGMLSRTLEVLDQRGVADRFVAEGTVHEDWGHSAGVQVDIADFPTRHNYALGIGQNHIERILAGWVDELPVKIHRGREVAGFAQDDDGVVVELSDGGSVRTGYLVGCDGGRSLIRKTAGIGFPGTEPTSSTLIAEVVMDGEPELGVRFDEKGVHAIGPLEDGRFGLVLREDRVDRTEPPTLEDVRELLVSLRGTDYGLRSATSVSRFTDATRQAETYRKGRVLLAGDAAHVHSPMGGQGLGTGVQDAVNLGWKLAQVLAGTSPESLLDTYHAERHPVGARVLKTTLALNALAPDDARTGALRDVLAEALSDDARARIAGRLSGLDIHYDLGEGHPLLGRRMPDLDIVTADGPRRVFSLLHDARPLLLAFDGSAQTDRVRRVEATYDGPWELPVLGEVSAPSAVLIRPDGYVAWVGEGSDDGLREALATWFGGGVR
jgi:2-polyprenyl-6-methoxyphenol hydroxylase-like FAD-dependent oxidoreductase